MEPTVQIEVFHKGRWHFAASFSLMSEAEVEKGAPAARGFLSYDIPYAVEYQGRPEAAISCCHPVSLELQKVQGWPAFLVDLLPGGAGRKHYRARDGIADGPAGDWQLLRVGAGNPPGNLRIASAALEPLDGHAGFERTEIIERGPDFIQYAADAGAPVTGSSDVQGDSPKFLLTQDAQGRWHADGALPDRLARKHWLVKYPRSKSASDRAVLRYEAIYARLAKEAGLRVAELPSYEHDTLFVPRFDRVVTASGVERIGLESLYSLCGVNQFGVRLPQERMCEALHNYTSDPQCEIEEFVLRDVLNVALGNTDNHGRNHAVLRHADGRVELSPLYDFAPMVLDDQGIARLCRWQAEEAGRPRWDEVAETLGTRIDAAPLRRRLREFAPVVAELVPKLIALGATDDLLGVITGRIRDVAQALEKVKV